MKKFLAYYLIFIGTYGLYSLLVPIFMTSNSSNPIISLNSYLFFVVCVFYILSGVFLNKYKSKDWFYLATIGLLLQVPTINYSSFVYELFIFAKIDLILMLANMKLSLIALLSSSFILDFDANVTNPFLAVNMLPILLILLTWYFSPPSDSSI